MSDDLKTISFKASNEFLAALESSRGRENRSLFIRRAVAELLKGRGLDVPDDWVYAPDRASEVLNETAEKFPLPPIKPAKPVTYRKTKSPKRKKT